MVAYEKIFLVVPWTQNSDWPKKNVLIDNHYKTIYAPVRIDRSSYRVNTDNPCEQTNQHDTDITSPHTTYTVQFVNFW